MKYSQYAVLKIDEKIVCIDRKTVARELILLTEPANARPE